MRNRIFAVLALAILAGGGLAYGTYNVINAQPVKTVNAPTQPVVVAAADLSLGAELKKEDLTIVDFPAGKAPAGSGPEREARVQGSRLRAAAGHS